LTAIAVNGSGGAVINNEKRIHSLFSPNPCFFMIREAIDLTQQRFTMMVMPTVGSKIQRF